MKFNDLLTKSIEIKKSNVCVGLDSRYDRIPAKMKKSKSISTSIFEFNQKIIEATHEVTSVYKENVAFYAGFGSEGLEGLRLTNEWLKSNFSNIPIFADCKRSEMGESVKMIKSEIFDWLQFDCVMVTPWFGFDTVRDYLDDDTIGVSVYAHDSNPTAAEFQDLELKDGRRVYEAVTENVVKHWNQNGNLCLEGGATYMPQLQRIRQIAGENMVLLAAGVGAQGANVAQLDKSLFGKNGMRLIVNSSRGIIFAGEGKSDYFEAVNAAATEFHRELTQQRGS